MVIPTIKKILAILWHLFAVIGILLTATIIYLNCIGANVNIEPGDKMKLAEQVELLQQAGSYGSDTVTFNIHSLQDSIKAQEIKAYFNIDSIVGNSATTWDKTIALAKFVASHIPHANQRVMPEKRNAIALWEYTKNVEPAFNCRLHSIMLFELLNAIDISATFITCMPKDSTDTDCHVVNQVWLPELNKWAMIDSDFDGNYATDKSGTPLSLAEIRERYISGEDIYFHNEFTEGSNEINYYYAYMAKNTYWFSSWETPTYDQEPMMQNPNSGRYIQLVPAGFEPFRKDSLDVATCDANQFWAKPSNVQ